MPYVQKCFFRVCVVRGKVNIPVSHGLRVPSPEKEEKTGSEMAARERRGRFLDLWSNFSSASASNRNFYKYSWMREEAVAPRCRGRKEGRALFSTWNAIFSRVAAFPGLSPMREEAKFSHTEAWAWCRNNNRNKLMVRERRDTARGAASLGWTERGRVRKHERRSRSKLHVHLQVTMFTNENSAHYRHH